jgi:hypothetical protein
VIRQVAKAAGFATLLALARTRQPSGGRGGAVYLPVASIMPTIALPPAIPLTAQVTAVLGIPSTDAVSRRSPPSGTLANGGETATVCAMAGAAAANQSTTPSVTRLSPYPHMLVPDRNVAAADD